VSVNGKHPRLKIHSTDPFVGGPPLSLLRRQPITPTALFFVRNHAPVPEIDSGNYQLQITGLTRTAAILSLHDLARFPRLTVTATLQCAGNRRDELMAVEPIPGEVPWGADAISTARWNGVRLRDVLESVGVAEGAQHVAFSGVDAVTRHGHTFGYGSSIPLAKALSAEVLLADTMNGEPLPPLHGFPLRVVVPGYIGARSVKWLHAITLQAAPSDNYFQSHSYRLFAPHVRAETVVWDEGLMLSEQSLNAVICTPEAGAVLRAGDVTVGGYAIAGGERAVARVDVSPDGGRTWHTARLPPAEPWAWQLWEIGLQLSPGPVELVVRACDSAANTQPERAASVWNFKGYMNNAWHRVRVNVAG
jgi:sulfite oxidase